MGSAGTACADPEILFRGGPPITTVFLCVFLVDFVIFSIAKPCADSESLVRGGQTLTRFIIIIILFS